MKILLPLCVLAGVTFLAGAGHGQELVVRIGHVAPLTGSAAHLGKDNENGARLAIDELNAKGVMIGGRKARLELVAEDDAADPKQGVAAAHRLVDLRVHGVVGHANSGTSIPAAPVYSAAGIPQVSPSATNPRFTRMGMKTTFRVLADDVQLGGALGKYAVKELRGKTFAIIDDRTAYGQGVADEFQKAVRTAGGRIVAREFTSDKSTDFMAILTTLKGKKPDIVFFGGMDAAAGPMLKQMKSLGIHAKFMGGDGICTSELARLAGDALTNGQVMCAEAGGAQGSQKQALDAFKARFKSRYGVDVMLWSPLAYDAVQVMVAAMVKAGSAEPGVYLPVLARTVDHKGVTDTISFDAKGDLKNGAVTLYTYKDGQRQATAVVR